MKRGMTKTSRQRVNYSLGRQQLKRCVRSCAPCAVVEFPYVRPSRFQPTTNKKPNVCFGMPHTPHDYSGDMIPAQHTGLSSCRKWSWIPALLAGAPQYAIKVYLGQTGVGGIIQLNDEAFRYVHSGIVLFKTGAIHTLCVVA